MAKVLKTAFPAPAFHGPANADLPRQHVTAKALNELVGRGIGTILLEGEAALGKSEFCRRYVEAADPARMVLLLSGIQGFDGKLLCSALSDLLVGPFGPRLDPARVIEKIAEKARAGTRLLVMIDQADRLPEQAWIALDGLIATGGPDRRAMVSLLLVGRPGMGSLLDKPFMAKLRKTTVARLNLPKLSLVESIEFVRDDLCHADHPIASAAVEVIARAGGGLPGRLATLTAAVEAAGRRRREWPVSVATAERAMAGAFRPRLFSKPTLWVAGGLAVLAFAIVPFWLATSDGSHHVQSPELPIARATGARLLPASTADAATTPVPASSGVPRGDGPAEPQSLPAASRGAAVETWRVDPVDVFLMPARQGDTLRKLYARVYRSAVRQITLDQLLEANPGKTADGALPSGELIGFPEPATAGASTSE